MDDLRFAIFGTGFWSHFQLAAWQELEGVKCVALYNRTVSKAEEMAQQFQIPAVYGDPEELLRHEKLDFIDIVTDPWSHSRFVRMAAAYKVPVICQKPMSPTPAEAESMVETCHRAGVPFFIHENWRWQAPIRELKKVLDSDAIGMPFRARITCVSGYPVFINEPWLKDWPEYIIFDMGCHLLDTARFLFGEAESLYCQVNRIHKDIKGEDVASIMLRMGSRTTVTIELGFAENYLEHDAVLSTPIFVEAENGSAEIDGDSRLRVTTKSGTHVTKVPLPSYSWVLPDYQVCHSSIVSCNANLLKALRNDGPAESPGDDYLKTMKLVFAAYDSARSGKTIQFAQNREPIMAS